MYLNAIGAAAELARRAAAALRLGTVGRGSAVGTAPELGVLTTAALLKRMNRGYLNRHFLQEIDHSNTVI